MSENSGENILDRNEVVVSTATVNEADTSENITDITEEPNQIIIKDIPESSKVSTSVPIPNISELVDKEKVPAEPIIEASPKLVKSRELKSLLDAVKEANLDTNIVHKRISDSHNINYTTKTLAKRRNSTSSNDSSQSSGKRSTRSQNPEFVQKHKKFLKSVTRAQIDDGEMENISFENNEDDDDWYHSANKQNISISGRKTPIYRPKTPTYRPKTPTNRSTSPITNPKTPTNRSRSPTNSSRPPMQLKTPKRRLESFDSIDGAIVDDVKKIKKTPSPLGITMKKDKDKFCWRCHREGINIQCETCPRSYHLKCLRIQIINVEHWPCPECIAIIKAESTKTRSPALKDMTQDHLCELLKFAVKRMIGCQGSEPFINPVDIKSFPDYRTYVIQPMDLTTLQNNIKDNIYGSTLAFLADAKWILHNSIIFNSHQSKLTTAAKAIIKVCKQEMGEIETCAECYLNANTKKSTWFVEVCSKPHILLWAKLKGFPFWPAKGMKTDNNNVHVKFFGAHDRAWVPVKECFLYSKKDPNTTNKYKRSNIADCVKEVDVHIEKLKGKFGDFSHAPYRLLYNPLEENQQLLMMLPNYDVNKTPIKLNLTVKPVQKRNISTDDLAKDGNLNKEDDNKAIYILSRSHSGETDITNNSPFSTSKSSLNSDDKNKTGSEYDKQDFDKFVEGYGTEDEDLGDELNVELRNKLAGDYITDSEDDNCSQSDSLGKKDNSEDDLDKSSMSSSDMSVLYRGKCRTRGGYHNVSGKIKIMTGRKSEELETGKKRSLENSPDKSPKCPRRESDDSFKSDSGKINKLILSNNIELSIGSTVEDSKISTHDAKSEEEKIKPLVPVTNDEPCNPNQSVSPQIKIESMADKLIKKINMTHIDTDTGKVAHVKKQILDNLEATSSTSKDDCIESVEPNKSNENKNTKEPETIKNDEKNAIKNNGNVTETAAADSQNKISSDDSSEEEFLQLKKVTKDYSLTDYCSKASKNETKPNQEQSLKEKASHEVLQKPKSLEVVQTVELANTQVLKTVPVLKKLLKKNKLVSSSRERYFSTDSSSDYDDTDSESERESETITHNLPNSNFIKMVNVSDIMSGKSNSTPSKNGTVKHLEKTAEKEKDSQIIQIHDSVEIKSEPVSEAEETEKIENQRSEKEKPQYDVTLSVVDKIKKVDKPASFKVVDNLTRIIDSVAKNAGPLSRNEISLNNINSLKQKARKSFPTIINKSMQTIQIKKIIPEKKETQVNTKPQTVPVKTAMQTTPKTIINTVNKDHLVYITHNQNSVVLPPNQPISIGTNVANPILAMVQHSSLNNTGILIQNSAPSIQIPSTIVTNTVTTSVDSVSSTQPSTPLVDILSEDVCKTVGDLLCKPPPKLKPKPPGPLSTYFDEGNPSSAGPVSKTINSIAHRLTDYFSGLLRETMTDLSDIGSQEARIKSLELEIENLKHKHTEEMLEFRKNISTILKDIQKSIVEERNKVIDETRGKCEAERLRSVEEAKSKQWCAYCLKEAQFYCCWNTSYCDYPCQQKHWATHMKTCSQSSARTNPAGNGTNVPNKPNSPAIFKALPKHYSPGTKVVKTARMFQLNQVKPGLTTQKSPVYIQRPMQIQGSAIPGQSTLTLVESTPGNFEIVGNHGPISLDGKLIPATIGKVKGTTVTTSTPPGLTPTTKTYILSQKPISVSKPVESATENK